MMIEIATIKSAAKFTASKLSGKGIASVYNKLTSKDFSDKFYACIVKATSKLQKKYPDALGGSISKFCNDEEIIKELLNLLFVNDTINASVFDEKFDTSTLPPSFATELVKLLSVELYLSADFTEILLLKQVSTIKNLLEQQQKDESLQKDFLEKYTKNLSNNFCQINFIGLGINHSVKKGRRKNLKDLFVKPTFSTNSKHLNKSLSRNKTNNKQSVGIRGSWLFNTKKMLFKKIFNHHHRIAIVGNAGSGKSTLAKFIALSILDTEEKVFENKEVYQKIPFRIELRKYYIYKKENGGNFINYLVYLLETEYAMSSLSVSQLEQLINTKDTLFIFDGLDEIFDINDKIAVKNDIENFHNNFKNVWSITTSRKSGYEDAALNEENTLKLYLNNFDDVKIETYIKKWYALEEENEAIRDDEVNILLEKRKLIAKELISNPLLLSLIVILFRNNLRLPESRLEIYQSCTETLVEKWDDSKNLTLDLDTKIYRRKSAILADLAFWQYEELSKEGVKEVTHERVKNTVVNSLIRKIKIDEYEAAYHAEKFLNYAQKRSIYIENDFTHKTFLEYYTAYWIYTNLEKKHKQKERNKLISEYIDNSFWHVVLELLINFIDKDQADTEIIDNLLLYQLKEDISSFDFFVKIFPTLQNISDEAIQKTWKIVIMYILEEREYPIYYYGDLAVYINKDNINIVQIAFEDIYYNENINKSHFFNLYLLVFSEISNIFKNFVLEKMTIKKEIQEFITRDAFSFHLYIELFENDIICEKPILYIQKFAKHFGKVALFREANHHIFASIFMSSTLNSCLESILEHSQLEQQFHFFIAELEKLEIEFSYILKYIIISQYDFRLNDEVLLKVINKIKNEKLELMIILIMYLPQSSTSYLNNYNLVRILPQITSKSIKSLIEKIINLKDERQALTLIAEHYNMPALLEEYDENELKT